MEAQEIFDTIVNHLRIQGRPCADEHRCRYRYANDVGGFDRCAVGVLIGDDEYSASMECMSPTNLLNEGLLPQRLVEHVLLLNELQGAHDGWNAHLKSFNHEYRGPLEPGLQKVAQQFNLTYTPPEAAPQITALTGIKERVEA